MEQETNLSSEYSELEARALYKAKERAHEIVKVVAAIGAVLISIGLAYGTLNGKVGEMDIKLRSLETVTKDRDELILRELSGIKTQLHNIEVYLRNGSNRPTNQSGGGR